MRTLCKNAIRSIVILSVMATLLFTSCIGAQEAKTSDPWRILKGYALSSVVWSPNGNHIAFVVTSRSDYGDADDLLQGSMWITSLPGHGQQQKIRRLARLTRKDGIPVALFWIDDDHIGWAAAHNSKWTHTFCFMQMGLHNGEPERLVSQNFSDGQGGFHRADGADLTMFTMMPVLIR